MSIDEETVKQLKVSNLTILECKFGSIESTAQKVKGF